MKLNYFKAAEQDIESLHTLKKALEHLYSKKVRLLQNIEQPGEIKSVDLSKPYIDSHYVNDTLNEVLGFAEVIQEINSTEEEIRHIETLLSELTDEQQKVLTMFYIDHLSAERIAEAINVESDKTVYNIRNKALMQYAVLSYGAKAIQATSSR